jgi:hypothetical protein
MGMKKDDIYRLVNGTYLRREKPMPVTIAYCGLICHTCPIYLATRQENKEEQVNMRIEIVRQCRERYGMNYRLADITDCDGCRTDGGGLFSGRGSCFIRKCARQKGLENCAFCTEYFCEQLGAHFKTDPTAQKRLEQISSSL